jgi:hypothetical protein
MAQREKETGRDRASGNGREQPHHSNNPIVRAARKVRQVFSRTKSGLKHEGQVVTPAPALGATIPPQEAAHQWRRESDVPMDELARAYTPSQTSLKSPFRADGLDRQRDQEFPDGAAGNRWNAEDRYTNHSGDPRIGTHGRSHETTEAVKSAEE